MHTAVSELEFLEDIRGTLIGLYAVAALINAVVAYAWWTRSNRDAASRRQVFLWSLVAIFFLALMSIAAGAEAASLRGLSWPLAWRDMADWLLGPTLFMTGIALSLAVLFRFRNFFTRGAVAFTGLNLAVLCLGLSLTDPDFAAIVLKPDNVPIVGLIFLLGFFTWLGARRAVLNDQRLAQGLGPLEAEDNEQVLVWPDVMYIELICAVAITALLIVWSLLLKAPLEAEASTVITPNPSKAPWYFLGLQEMLLYYDPWLAGVVLPGLIIFGLCAIPYLDFNRQGSGYYTINQRRFAYLTFQFGFLILWILLMLIGTFFRGPNWSFFGPFETWDVHKVEALNNVKLSERFWVDLLHRPVPGAARGDGGLAHLPLILWREAPGILLLGLYFLALPGLLARFTGRFRHYRQAMGQPRYAVLMLLLLMMALLPIKMVCRWLFNLNYFVSIPEYFFNF